MSVTEPKNPVDVAVELLVFAPVGLALSVRELLPKLVERGRQQLTGQVATARMLGQFAVKQGQTEAGKAFDRARASAQESLEQLGVRDRQARPSTRTNSSPAPAAVSPEPGRTTPEPTTIRPEPDAIRPVPTSAPVGTNGAAVLAIPAYDSLSASQVVPRLSGLSPDELESVRAYEAANRGRKTILAKVAQLQP